MSSSGYTQVIQYVSAIMDKFSLKKDLIKKSFTITGIPQSDPELFHSALKHVLNSNDTSIAILNDLDVGNMFLDNEEIEYVDSDDENLNFKKPQEFQVMMKIKLNSINLQIFIILYLINIIKNINY